MTLWDESTRVRNYKGVLCMSAYMDLFIWMAIFLFIFAIISIVDLKNSARKNITKDVLLSINNILNYNIDALYSPEIKISRLRIYGDVKKLNIFVSRLGNGNLRFEQQLDKSARSEVLELSNIGKELDIATNVNEHSEGVLFSAEISGAQNAKLFLGKVLIELFGFQPQQELWVKHQFGR